MRAGELSDIVIFEERIVTPINAESNAITWAEDFRIHSHVERQSETVARFVIRYRSGITPISHRLIWDNAIWNITSATHDRRRSMWMLDCDFSMMIESTDLASTEREFIDGLTLLRPGP